MALVVCLTRSRLCDVSVLVSLIQRTAASMSWLRNGLLRGRQNMSRREAQEAAGYLT
jgi:hypothetical protein